MIRMEILTVLTATFGFLSLTESFKLNDIDGLHRLKEGKFVSIEANDAGIEKGDYFIRTVHKYSCGRMSIDLVKKGSINNNLIISVYEGPIYDHPSQLLWKVSYTTTLTIPVEAISGVEVKEK